jgi:hypothetical protein
MLYQLLTCFISYTSAFICPLVLFGLLKAAAPAYCTSLAAEMLYQLLTCFTCCTSGSSRPPQSSGANSCIKALYVKALLRLLYLALKQSV